MVHGVVAHQVPFVQHTLDQLGLFPHILAGEEEQTGSLLFLEGIENFRGGAVFIAAVEGEVADLFLGIALVDAVVLVEDFDGFIPSVPLDGDFTGGQVADQLAGVPVAGFQIAVGEVNAPYGIQVGDGGKAAVIPLREAVDVLSVHEVPVFAVLEPFAGCGGGAGGIGLGTGIRGNIGFTGIGGDAVFGSLYADAACTTPVCGDIATEVLDIEQVYMGDPTLEDIQQQPSIIIAQRRPLAEVQRLAKAHGCRFWQEIRGDEQEGRGGHATLLTRFWKEWNEDGSACTVKAVQVCGEVTVRATWDLGVRLYPLAVFRWEEKRHQCYGESEIPYLIPNQIAINRTISAGVWAVMMMGMPIMLVNGDVVTGPITNDPGQVIPVYGSGEEVKDAVRYVDPPAFSAQLDANVQSLIRDTMTQAGVSATLLGDVEPTNTSAIIAVREASLMPLTAMQNRFYTFLEEVARVWSEFWMTMYGDRALKIAEEQGVWYMPFDSAACRKLLLSIRVDVGDSDRFSETRTIETLDNLYSHGVIDAKQYLSRLPRGTVPRLDSLLQELTV